MPEVRRKNLPPALLNHPFDRVQERRISYLIAGCPRTRLRMAGRLERTRLRLKMSHPLAVSTGQEIVVPNSLLIVLTLLP